MADRNASVALDGTGLARIESRTRGSSQCESFLLRRPRAASDPSSCNFKEEPDDSQRRSRSRPLSHERPSAEFRMKQITKVAKKRSIARAKSRSRTGGAVANFLEEDGVLEDAEAIAIKRVLAWELEESMRADGISKQTLAARMCTSRSQLDRLLDPKNAR